MPADGRPDRCAKRHGTPGRSRPATGGHLPTWAPGRRQVPWTRSLLLIGLLAALTGGCAIDRSGYDPIADDGPVTLIVDAGVADEPATPLPSDPPATPPPTARPTIDFELTDLTPAIVAHGARLSARGVMLSGVERVTLGGQEQLFEVAGDRLLVGPIDDATPIGSQSLVLATAAGEGLPEEVVVIHLVINEVEVVTDWGPNLSQFVEVATSVPNVPLEDYSFVAFDGRGRAYGLGALERPADGEGLLVIGSAWVVPAPGMEIPADALNENSGAIALYQGSGVGFGDPVSTANLIDAVVYGMNSDANNLREFLLTPEGRDRLAEGLGESLQRCGASRRDGRAMRLDRPNPGSQMPCVSPRH